MVERTFDLTQNYKNYLQQIIVRKVLQKSNFFYEKIDIVYVKKLSLNQKKYLYYL